MRCQKSEGTVIVLHLLSSVGTGVSRLRLGDISSLIPGDDIATMGERPFAKSLSCWNPGESNPWNMRAAGFCQEQWTLVKLSLQPWRTCEMSKHTFLGGGDICAGGLGALDNPEKNEALGKAAAGRLAISSGRERGGEEVTASVTAPDSVRTTSVHDTVMNPKHN